MTRSTTLDILRAVAVIAVLGRHMIPCPSETNLFLHVLTEKWRQGGWVGVDLFFVLSGFLISGLLFREHAQYRAIAWGRFFVRRGFKIYPSFYALILITIAELVVMGEPVPLRRVINEIFFIQNYGVGLWGHTWSLGVEEHFYIGLPIVLFLLLRLSDAHGNPFKWIPAVFCSIALVCLGLRLQVAASSLTYTHRAGLFPSHLRIDSLFSGVLISYWYHYYPVRFQAITNRYRWILFSAGILSFVPAFAFKLETTRFLYTYGLTILWAGSGCLVASLINIQPSVTPWVRALSFAGARSYTIYLWHIPFSLWVVDRLTQRIFGHFNWYFYAVAYLVGAVMFGGVMGAIIDGPMIQLRDRLFPSRAQPLAAR